MRITVLSRVDCHLCVQAEQAVRRVIDGTAHLVEVVDVDADPELRAEYGDLVPVILIDGAEHGYHRVDEDRLRAALA